MSAPGAADRALYEREVKRHLLALREALVRHDENLKAHQLLEAAPYFLLDDHEVAKARADQREMVLHILEPEAYVDYYGSNPNERPFEEQYGIAPDVAHQHLYRVAFLRARLRALCQRTNRAAGEIRLLDVSANDGWMAVNLGAAGFTTDCIDLHPGNCELAERRRAGASGIGLVLCEDLLNLPGLLVAGELADDTYDAIACFETLEHVADPDAALEALCSALAPDGRLFLSTPHEAVERGNVPDWARVERKGHVRVFREQDLRNLLERHGTVERFEVGPDRVMVAEVSP